MSEQKPLHYLGEISQNAAEGNDLLSTMVMDSLGQSSMPPAPIFRWFAMHILYKFMQYEEVYLSNDSGEAQESQEATLADMAEVLSMTMKVAGKQKMFALAEELRSALLRRKLRFPPTMDMTYGGLLP